MFSESRTFVSSCGHRKRHMPCLTENRDKELIHITHRWITTKAEQITEFL